MSERTVIAVSDGAALADYRDPKHNPAINPAAPPYAPADWWCVGCGVAATTDPDGWLLPCASCGASGATVHRPAAKDDEDAR